MKNACDVVSFAGPIRFLVVASGIAACGSAAWGAETPTDRANATAATAQPDTVVVTGYRAPPSSTATKTGTALIDTPVSIQVVPEDVILDRDAQRLEDVLRNVSGVQAQHAYGGGNEVFVLRGFQQSPATNRNGVSAPLVRRVDLGNVEQVEVLKGPSATVYGSSDPGGIVNVVTKLPSVERDFNVEQSLGSWNYSRTQIGASSAVNAEDTLAYRVDFAHEDFETFRQLSDNKRTFVAPTLSFLPNAATRINLALEYSKDDLVYDSGIPAYGTGIADIPRERSFIQPGLGDEHESSLGDLNLSHQFNDVWSLSAGLLDFSVDRSLEDLYMWANLAPGDTTGYRFAWFGDENVDTAASWVHVTGRLQSGRVTHTLLLGTEYAKTDSHSDGTDILVDDIDVFTFDPYLSAVPTAPFEAAPPAFLSDQKHRNLGLFVQDQIQLSDRLQLMAGLRRDRLKRRGYAEYFGPYDDTQREDSQNSPRVGLTWKLAPTVALYGSCAKSFGPGFNFEGASVLEPETAKQYEIGFKTERADGDLQLSAALFELTKSNIPTPHPTIPALTVSIGEAQSRGLEFDLQGQLTDGLSLVVNYAWTDTEITEDYSGNQGHRLPYSAEHQVNVWLKYELSGRLDGLSIGGGVFGASDRFGDAANSYKDDGFAQMDLFAAYRFSIGNGRMMTAQINVNNVNDELYYTMRNRWSNLPNAQRSVFASIKVAF